VCDRIVCTCIMNVQGGGVFDCERKKQKCVARLGLAGMVEKGVRLRET